MCGIGGLIRSDGLIPGDLEAVGAIIEAERHRGPDGSGLQQNGCAVLGHRRLSIIDLSTAGLQPMCNEDQSVWITYNGEIYNHRELRNDLIAAGHKFQSQTDTEVLVHGYEEWGIARLLPKLRGMFAFAIHDSRNGLILARDRMGIKPLYYCRDEKRLVFASEVKALAGSGLVPGKIDRQALAGYLIAGSVPSPLTLNKSIECLPPGHWAAWRAGHFTVQQYWDLNTASKQDDEGTPDLRGLLEQTVERHLISDVPVGVFLSGGVDSAGLVALASRVRQRQGEPLRTLTVVFDEVSHSEAAPAREIAERFHTRHEEIRITSADFKSELPAFLNSMDQPTNDGLNSYFVSKAAREAGLKVVLSGLGGDEVFWGYRHYRWLTQYGPWLNACPDLARHCLAHAAAGWGHLRGRDNWLRMEYLAASAAAERLYLTMRGFFAPGQAAQLLDIGAAELNANIEEQFRGFPTQDLAAGFAFNYLEFKRYLHDQLLRDTDVFSMAHSIEARVPYLDHLLVEQLWPVKAARKLNGKTNKRLLVDAVDDPLLTDAGNRQKRGFSFPMDRWMRSYSGELEDLSCASDLLDRKAVRRVWQDFQGGKVHWSRPWALAVLGGRN